MKKNNNNKQNSGKAMLYSAVLVTGCGGDIGLGIGKILKSSNIAATIVGCDIHNEHPGEMVFDKCEIVSRANSDDYFERMHEIIKKHSVELIIPTSEPELRFLSEQNIYESFNGIPMICANERAISIGFDKLLTANFLKSLDMPYPWTMIVKDGPPKSIPCIIKSRQGAGSRDVNLVDKELVEYYSSNRQEYIWQEYLQPDDQEYTCGLYKTGNGEARVIVIKRHLHGDATGYGEVVHNDEIEKQLIKLAQALELKGSINVQLRLTDRGPVIFEINPRFSSTVVFRHLMGYKDLIWSLIEKKGGSLESYEPPRTGTRFFRGSHEFIWESDDYS